MGQLVFGTKFFSIIMLFLIFLLPHTPTIFGATVNWDGGGDGSDWFDPLNWDLDVLPLGSDNVVIDGNANVDLSNQFLISTGSLTIKSGSSLFMTEESPTTVLGIGGTLTNNGTLTISNEVELTGTMTNNGNIVIQFEFDNPSPQIFIADEQGILINNGDILVDSDTELGNFNLLYNFGTITIAADGRYENGFNTTNSAIFTVGQDSTVSNSFNFTNDGTLIIEGSFTGDDNDEVILVNNGKIENKNSGTFHVSSENQFINNGNFTNSGNAFIASATNNDLIFNLQILTINNVVSNGNNLTNSGTINLTGELSVGGNGFLRNTGQITLGKDFGGEGTDDGKITNNGIFENNNSIDITIGDISNNDEIKNYGTITNNDQVNNGNNGEITNVGTINNNGIINNQNIINDCGSIIGASPVGGTLNNFCPATIIVVKDTVPDASTDFAFTSSTLLPAVFDLDDDSQGPLQNIQEFGGLVPSLYDVTETFDSNYITDSACDDGSLVNSIDAQDDEIITCTFLNTLDSDLDGILAQIDTNSASFSNDFDDEPLGGSGQTNGTITNRQSLTVWITDEPNPDGVKIRALNGPSQNATVSVCNGASTISINDGDEVLITCGSVDITTNFGNPDILLNSLGGIKSSLVLPQGNKIFFDPKTFVFSVPSKNSNSLLVSIGTKAPISFELPKNAENSISFKPDTITFTTDQNNESTIVVTIGDKQEIIPPNSNISTLIVADQIIKTSKNQPVEITLSSLGGDENTESIFEITSLPSSGTIIQNFEHISYIPNDNFFGSDQLHFKAVKGNENSNSGTIFIDVTDNVTLEKQKIKGRYLGKLNDMSFDTKGIFKIGKTIFKKVNTIGTFETVEKNDHCLDVIGNGIMDFKKGNALNIEFHAETCKKKFFSKLTGTLEFHGGTGIFEDAIGTGEFSQIIIKNRLIGQLNGDLFIKNR